MSLTMRALIWQGPRVCAVVDRPRPVALETEAVVDVAYVGLCGTDLHIWAGEHPRAHPGVVIGHEIVGRLHADWNGVPAGAPVFVNPLRSCGQCRPCRRGLVHVCERLGLLGIDAPGGAAEQVAVPIDHLVPLPEQTDLRRAALIEPIAVGIRAVRRSRMRIGDSVHVIGAGPIGLIVASLAKRAGAGLLTVSETSPRRIETARSFGLTVAAESSDPPADVVFDCTGAPPVAATVTQWVATGGTLVVTGVYPGVVGFNLQDVLFRELTVVSTRVYAREDIDAAVLLVTQGGLDLSGLITDVVPLADAQAAMLRLTTGEAMKVLLSQNA